MQLSYYQPQIQNHSRVRHLRGGVAPAAHLGGGLSQSFEIVVGALLLLSPMFWLFIAELIK